MDVPILGSVPETDTDRLTPEQRIEQLEEFAAWAVVRIQWLADQHAHIAGALVAIVESVKAEAETADTTVDL